MLTVELYDPYSGRVRPHLPILLFLNSTANQYSLTSQLPRLKPPYSHSRLQLFWESVRRLHPIILNTGYSRNANYPHPQFSSNKNLQIQQPITSNKSSATVLLQPPIILLSFSTANQYCDWPKRYGITSQLPRITKVIEYGRLRQLSSSHTPPQINIVIHIKGAASLANDLELIERPCDSVRLLLPITLIPIFTANQYDLTSQLPFTKDLFRNGTAL